MPLVGIENWMEYRRHGEQFLHVALMARRKGKKHFTPEIIYNLTGMAIEKLIMAYLMKHGDLADNHTMTDLATALERHAGDQPRLTERIRYLDSFQEICDLDSFKLNKPNEEDTNTILAIGEEVLDFLTPLLIN
jgi:HEPN domain-containing protein